MSRSYSTYKRDYAYKVSDPSTPDVKVREYFIKDNEEKLELLARNERSQKYNYGKRGSAIIKRQIVEGVLRKTKNVRAAYRALIKKSPKRMCAETAFDWFGVLDMTHCTERIEWRPKFFVDGENVRPGTELIETEARNPKWKSLWNSKPPTPEEELKRKKNDLLLSIRDNKDYLRRLEWRKETIERFAKATVQEAIERTNEKIADLYKQLSNLK